MCRCGLPRCCGLFAIIVNNWNIVSDSFWDIYLNGVFLKSLDLEIVTDPMTTIGGLEIVTAGMGGIFTDLDEFSLDDNGEGTDDLLFNVFPHSRVTWSGLFPPTKQGYFEESLLASDLINGSNRLEMRWVAPTPDLGSEGDIFLGTIVKHRGRWKLCDTWKTTGLFTQVGAGAPVAQPVLADGHFYRYRYFSDDSDPGLKLIYEFDYPQG